MDGLANLREEIINEIKEKLSVIASGAPVIELGSSFEDLIDLFQALGSCNLLLFLDTTGFRRNLFFSGAARRYYLTRSQREGNEESIYLAISRSQAFFDALVARHDELVYDIIRLSPKAWVPDGEYEDDYCYHALLHSIWLNEGRSGNGTAVNVLNRFERVLNGGSSPRLEICRAFLENDPTGFEDALNALLAAHEAWMEENEKFLGHDPAFVLRGRFFVEGVALLRMAEQRGFGVQEEYQLCPSAALLPLTDRWPPDLFIDVDRIAAEGRARSDINGG